MKIRTSKRIKRVLSGMLSLVMTASLASAFPSVAAQEADKYPYVLFASNNKEGAITVNAQSFNVNGNIATNGSLFKSGNMNLNGMKSENIGESMPFFVDKIEEVYFSGEYEFYTEDYILVETNVNHSKPIKVQGNSTLDGNINSSSALMVQNNISIEGNTINGNNSVLCAQYGNISIDCSNVNISGLIYAPMGTVEITADNISLNSVVVIADEIVLEANNVNVGYSSWAGQLVGTEFTETPDDEIDYEKDTDEDGIPDFIEEEFGTDINNSDTDNDGLSDLFELVNGTTDPTTSDSDSNGVPDADEDYDKDGLTSLEEQETGTDPTDKDSDSDGVSDGDEVNIHNTNPIVKDTDEDGLYDGEEIYFESDPNNKDTNGDGISDGDEKREQTFEYDYSDEDCAVIGVNITMNATGNIYRTTSVKSVMDKDILCSDVVGLVGEPFEIETTSQFDNATITFEVDKTKLGETQFDELIFLWYDEENYRFVEMETTYDEINSTVSTQTTHFSKYMIVDLTQWAAVWETPIVAQLYEEESVPKYSNVLFTMPAATTDTDVDGFVLSEDNTVSCQKIDIARELFESVTDQQCYYGLYQLVDGQVCCAWNTLKNTDAEGIQPLDFFNRLAQYINSDVAVQIFNVIRVGWGFRNCVEIFFISDNYETDTFGFSYEYYVDMHEIPVYIVDLREGYDEYLNKIASDTGGEYLKNTAENIEYLKEVINERETVRNVITSEYLIAPTSKADTDSDGFLDEQETNGIRIQNGRFITIDPANADSDFDALSDGVEIDTSLCYKDTPVINQKTGETIHVAGYYYVMCSDPNNPDTDGDGYMDGEDPRPNINDITVYELTSDYVSVDASVLGWDNYTSTNTNISYGGAQTWFSSLGKEDKPKPYEQGKRLNYAIRYYGCGLISVSDILLYLAKSNPDYATEYTNSVLVYNDNYLHSTYDMYVHELEKYYFQMQTNAWMTLGLPGCNAAYGMNEYFDICNIDYYANWGVEDKNILPCIIEMINNDIPVMMSIGPDIHEKGVEFYYTVNADLGKKVNIDDFEKYGEVNSHYVTVTGAQYDAIKDKYYLIVSSWGKQFIIDYDEYYVYKNNGSLANFFDDFTNILYIYKSI